MALEFNRQATTAETKIVMEFPHQSKYWSVKNFTGGDIYVGGGKTDLTKADMLLIPASCAQLVVFPMDWDLGYGGIPYPNIIVIIPEETNEKGVEVQCIKWET